MLTRSRRESSGLGDTACAGVTISPGRIGDDAPETALPVAAAVKAPDLPARTTTPPVPRLSGFRLSSDLVPAVHSDARGLTSSGASAIRIAGYQAERGRQSCQPSAISFQQCQVLTKSWRAGGGVLPELPPRREPGDQNRRLWSVSGPYRAGTFLMARRTAAGGAAKERE